MAVPLAQRMRPTTLDQVVGQTHLLGEGGILRRIVESGEIPNMIFYGPSGVGKTTVAEIIAKAAHKRIKKLNGTTMSTQDMKEIFAELDTFSGINGFLLYLDEIQYLNKKQQQTLLEYIENGSITLIASTTENPYFYIYNAILSRCTVFTFHPVDAADIEQALARAVDFLQEEQQAAITVEEDVLNRIANSCGNDVRKAMNILEMCFLATCREGKAHLDHQTVETLLKQSNMRYSRDGDEHYNILSAFQKSVRGSDPDAAVHYLARLLVAGDLLSACRRLMVMASEDIGLAYPQAAAIVKSCVDSALQLGLPEARLPLCEATLLLATAPKSNSTILAIDAAMQDVQNLDVGDVPDYLKDSHYQGAKYLGVGQGYQYVHNFKNAYLKQQYLPDNIKNKVYYHYGQNKMEQASKIYWDAIKKSE